MNSESLSSHCLMELREYCPRQKLDKRFPDDTAPLFSQKSGENLSQIRQFPWGKRREININ